MNTIKNETGTYIELPKEKIKFVSKEAEIIFDLSMENDYLKKENQELKGKIKKLSQWDINKDTRNSRQRVANAKLLKEIQQLKKQLEDTNEELELVRCDLHNRTSERDSYYRNIEIIENQQKEFIEWLEAMSKMYENEYKDIDIAGHYNCVLIKYKEIIGE